MIDPLLSLHFGADAAGQVALQEGWSPPEDGFCWSLAPRAAIALTMPVADGALFLELDLNPFGPPALPGRRLRLALDGRMLAEDFLPGEGILAYRLPPALPAGKEVILSLETDPGPTPALLGISPDKRPLAFMLRELRLVATAPAPRATATALPPLSLPGDAITCHDAVRALTGLTGRELVLNFESLGHNCEFGLLQRQLDAEPKSMLRFAGITLNQLVHGMRADFSEVGEDISVALHGHEYIVKEMHYGFGLHSFQGPDRATPAKIAALHGKRLKFTATLFRDLLKSGEKLFVFQRGGQILPAQARTLLNLLQAYGPNALLFVDQDPALPSGAIEQLGHGFYHGKLSRLAPAWDAGQLDMAGWLSLCVNAWRLWQKR